jgi:SAM-dependent methyltransferase
VGSDLHAVPVAPRGQSPLLWATLQSLVIGNGSAEPLRVLDCGGGSGSLAVPLAVQGAEVTVVDVSIDALAVLRRRADEAGVSDRVTAVQGEAETLTELVPAGSFHLVLAHEVLEVLPTVSLGLDQIAAALCPGGVASIVVANPVAAVLGRALSGDLDGALESLRRSRDSALGLDALVRACERAGLGVESIEGIGVFSEMVPGVELERPGAMTALAELEAATAGVSPFREIAAKLHLTARRVDAADGA